MVNVRIKVYGVTVSKWAGKANKLSDMDINTGNRANMGQKRKREGFQRICVYLYRHPA